MIKKLCIIGASGHAKVVTETAHELGYEIQGYYDDAFSAHNTSFLGKPILGRINDIKNIFSDTEFVIAIGNNVVRKKIVTDLDKLHWAVLIHPSTVISKTAIINKGTVVFAGAVIQADVFIGAHCIVNTSASVDHDSNVASFAHLAPGTHLAGNVSVGEGVFLGIGAVVIPQINIGNYSIVGAGSVVISNLPENVTAIGCPAKIKERNL